MTAPSLTAQAVAELVGGRLSGNGALVLRRVAPLDGAVAGDLSLLASSRYLPQFLASGADCVLLPPGLATVAGGPPTRIVVDDPQRALHVVLPRLYPPPPSPAGVHPTVVLEPGVHLGSGVRIGPHAVIGPAARLGERVQVGPGSVLEAGVVVGDDTVIGPRVIICTGAVIGRRVTIKAGAVIGGTGFGYLSGPGGHERILHIGGCRIGDDVDIGSNSCVDRGSIGDTVIGNGSRLDNHVHIAHNVRIGEHCLLMAGVAIAGSTRVGNRVILAGQAGLVGHLSIGDDVRVGAQSGVTSSIPAGEDVSGFPARPHREYMRAVGAMYRLAPLARRLAALVADPDPHG